MRRRKEIEKEKKGEEKKESSGKFFVLSSFPRNLACFLYPFPLSFFSFLPFSFFSFFSF